MANHTLIISNGTFIQGNKSECKVISAAEAIIGDWKCEITSKGLTCKCEQACGLNSKATLKYSIFKNGLSRLVLKLPGTNPIIKKKKWLTKPNRFNLDGALHLSDGDITSRYANFYINKQQ